MFAKHVFWDAAFPFVFHIFITSLYIFNLYFMFSSHGIPLSWSWNIRFCHTPIWVFVYISFFSHLRPFVCSTFKLIILSTNQHISSTMSFSSTNIHITKSCLIIWFICCSKTNRSFFSIMRVLDNDDFQGGHRVFPVNT